MGASIVFVCNENKYHNMPGNMVEDVMSKTVKTLNENQDIFDAIEVFVNNSFQCLPVVDDDGKYVGILKRSEVMRSVATY